LFRPPLLPRCCYWNRSLPAGNHAKPQALAFYVRALPSCRQFPPTIASLSPSTTHIKEETLLAILLLNAGKVGPQRKTDLVPIHSPLDLPNLNVTTFIESRSRSDPGRSDTVFLLSLPIIDVDVRTDCSVLSPLGVGGAGINAVCERSSSFSSLSYSAGPVFSSFSAESSALVHDLEWCHSHLKSCNFQSALFLTDSHSALTLLSSAPAFL